MENLDYKKEYDEFIENYTEGQPTNGETIGKFICRVVQYFSRAMLSWVSARIAYNKVAKTIATEVDENTGKSISVAKATILIEATDEGSNLLLTKAELEIIQEMLSSLRALQRGALVDQQHQGLT